MFNVGDYIQYIAYNSTVNSILATGKIYKVVHVTWNNYGFEKVVLEGLDQPDIYYTFAADMFILAKREIDYLAITREFA